MIKSINDFNNVFFIGVAGTGMSAIAQYLKGIGKEVSGSDRYFHPNEPNETKEKLEAEGIRCFLQNGEGITNATDLVVVSAAVEDTVEEVIKAKQLNIPIIKRAELLAIIARSKKTIAVGGTSGKSTTSAMLFDILQHANMQPSIISGAGLTSIIKEARPDGSVGRGKIGNAKVGSGDWLVIEADESDGSIVNYTPEVGLLINIDKDHKEIDTLIEIFEQFKKNTSEFFVVNQSHALAKQLSANPAHNFSVDTSDDAAYHATDFKQDGFSISFEVKKSGGHSLITDHSSFILHSLGKHNMENALAAATVANLIGVPLQTAAEALKNYEGIYRRHQIIGQKNNVWLIDDYAHNPAKCAASIEACQPLAKKVIAWFQPHGYGPTKFLRNDFVEEISKALRPEDEIWMSEIFYAGGTTVKDISANDLINDLKAKGAQAFFVENRNDLVSTLRPHFTEDCVLLLMGARDPGLEQFAKTVWEQL
jgi:UDP-N-acetylmuramate--alanine ligase